MIGLVIYVPNAPTRPKVFGFVVPVVAVGTLKQWAAAARKTPGVVERSVSRRITTECAVSARRARPRLPTIAKGGLRQRLLLASASLRAVPNTGDAARLLDRQDRSQCRARQEDAASAEAIEVERVGRVGVPDTCRGAGSAHKTIGPISRAR